MRNQILVLILFFCSGLWGCTFISEPDIGASSEGPGFYGDDGEPDPLGEDRVAQVRAQRLEAPTRTVKISHHLQRHQTQIRSPMRSSKQSTVRSATLMRL